MKKQEFFIKDWTTGQLNALVKTLGEENARGILDGTTEFQISKPEPKWTEKNGVIRLSDSVVSDGTTGPEWINRLTKGGYHLSNYAKQVLQSDKFNPTNGVTYQVAILKGNLFSDEERTTETVRAQAEKLGLGTPHPEVACLLREKLSDEEMEKMGLTWLITMHEPIEDFVGDPRLLSLCRFGVGRRLSALVDEPGYRWSPDDGFVLVSQGTVD